MSVFVLDQDRVRIMAESMVRASKMQRDTISLPLVFALVPDTEGVDIGGIAKVLYNANVKAYNERYPRREGKGDYEIFDETKLIRNEFPIAQNGLVALHKQVACWLYQCDEVQDLETSHIVESVREWHNRLAHKIVRGIADYDKLAWG